MTERFDVIVVGGGGSGLAAAVSASEAGARVILLEKQPALGGTTGIAIGSFTANRTPLQRAAGLDDSLDDHAVDAGLFAPAEIESRNNAELREYFLKHGADTLEWLRRMGITFQGPAPEPPNRVPRMHNVVPSARVYIATLADRLRKLGGCVRTGCAVVDLIQRDGSVTGVVAECRGVRSEIEATRGVILAAGDYANSPELIARFKGAGYAEIEGINPNATGDGHSLAEAAGAGLVNMDVTYGPELRFIAPQRSDWLRRLPTRGPIAWLISGIGPLAPKFIVARIARRMLVTWQHPETALFDQGAILINQEGRRFCDETDGASREIAIANQPQKHAYLLLDEWLIDRFSEWPHFVSTAPEIAYAYVDDYLRLRPDVAVAGNTLDSVARRRSISAAALTETLGEYNKQAAASGRRTLSGSRWVLLGPVKAWFTTTEGGAAIDQQFRVLDANERVIPGLYAVGQNGLGGQILWGHGLHIAWAMTSGRLAGRVVAGLSD